MRRYFTLLSCMAAVLLVIAAFEPYAHARAGGGRSMGSRGIRSYSQPARPMQSSPSRPQATPQQAPLAPSPYPQPARRGLFGNFASGMLGGIAGGMLGGMLFRSLGFGGMGGGYGGGIGLFDILLLAGIGYLIYRFVKKKREAESSPQPVYDQGYQYQSQAASGHAYQEPVQNDLEMGLARIRQMDPSFDEQRFKDNVMDVFFKVQGAWMNRDLASASALLTDEMRRVLQGDVDAMLRDRRVNRLENIAVRNVDITEAWQESGQDYLTVLIYANLLDYTTDDATGQVVAGSKTDPVKFEEFWTFVRAVGNNPWRLSAIDQS